MSINRSLRFPLILFSIVVSIGGVLVLAGLRAREEAQRSVVK
jgi:hypothetical protein